MQKGVTDNQKMLPIYLEAGFVPESQKKDLKHFGSVALGIRVIQQERTWISVPYSPWGGFFSTSITNHDDFNGLLLLLKSEGQKSGVTELVIKQPPMIYAHQISAEYLMQKGFKIIQQEHNQFIDLTKPIKLHAMEKRKLDALSDAYIVEPSTAWDKLHNFIASCRSQQGLSINVTLDRLNSLIKLFPTKYDGWVIKKGTKIISACITVQVTPTHIYYYLPATDYAARAQSPMVSLLVHMIDHYSAIGFRFFDLGQSSINGIKQEGLFAFKERMGAKDTPKNTLSLDLTL
ncbi:MAG: lipid II:glycine glycyltransferase (peptidoglycan interpeptide bridge formation enzyme) [Cyclobacteriaceae bacterium]|jgi:lipid II:glycine glycyltransferase (peptidoglycan interpeptide bridge formation enzyme)